MPKNLDETVRLQSKKREEWMQEVRRKETTRDSRSSSPYLANSSVASLPEKNECPGTHCKLIVKGERKDSSCQMCQKVHDKKKIKQRTKPELERKREIADLLVLPRPAESLQNGAGFRGST